MDGGVTLADIVEKTLLNQKMYKQFNRDNKSGFIQRHVQRVQFQTRKLLQTNPGKLPAL